MDQNNNFNMQGYNNFTNNQPNTNMNNNFYQPPVNNQSPKRKPNIGLIVGIAVVAVVAVVGVVFGSKLLSNKATNNSNGGSSNNEKVDVVYYDSNRKLKDVYTFDEATNKFAFVVNESTLIFESRDKISFYSLVQDNTIHNEKFNIQFYYKQDIYTSLGTIYLGESNSLSLDEFKTNFNSGILSNNTKWTVENVNIIESNDEYVFASWLNKGLTTSYEYYFAKKIGNKVFYVYNNSFTELNDTKLSLLLNEFKEFFTCLSVDNGEEPYIYDKVMNVPIVLDKKISDNKLIYSISKSKNEYLDGSVSFTLDSDYIDLEYGADGHYDKINWSKNLNSKIKYSTEDNKITLGIKDGNLTQIFQFNIYSDNKITNTKEFNTYIDKVLNVR